MHGANTNPYVISGGVAEEPSEALSFLKPLQGSSPLNIRYRDKKLSFFFLKIVDKSVQGDYNVNS